jgi:hypothetical protein
MLSVAFAAGPLLATVVAQIEFGGAPGFGAASKTSSIPPSAIVRPSTPRLVAPLPSPARDQSQGSVVPAAAATALSPGMNDVRFLESGLPLGTSWWMSLDGGTPMGSTTSALALTLGSAAYHYTVGSANSSYLSPGGMFTVSGGPMVAAVVFSVEAYTVSFTEAGLPPGTNWSVTFNGHSEAGAGAIGFAGIPNGTYRFSIGAEPGFTATPGSGELPVRGHPSPMEIGFESPPTALSGPPASGGFTSLVEAGVVLAVTAVGVVAWLRHGPRPQGRSRTGGAGIHRPARRRPGLATSGRPPKAPPRRNP